MAPGRLIWLFNKQSLRSGTCVTQSQNNVYKASPKHVALDYRRLYIDKVGLYVSDTSVMRRQVTCYTAELDKSEQQFKRGFAQASATEVF